MVNMMYQHFGLTYGIMTIRLVITRGRKLFVDTERVFLHCVYFPNFLNSSGILLSIWRFLHQLTVGEDWPACF